MSSSSSNPLPVQDSAESSGREAILDCACTLFAEGGFAGTSMRKLARAAKTSQALIHHHFGTKAGLYRSVRERLVGRLAEAEVLTPESTAETADPVEHLTTTMRRYADFLLQNPEFTRLSTWARLEGDDEPWSNPEELLSPMAAALRHLQDIGVLRRDLDVSLHMALLGGVVEHWVSHQGLYRQIFAPNENLDSITHRYFAQTASVIIHGASARPELS